MLTIQYHLVIAQGWHMILCKVTKRSHVNTINTLQPPADQCSWGGSSWNDDISLHVWKLGLVVSESLETMLKEMAYRVRGPWKQILVLELTSSEFSPPPLPHHLSHSFS